MHKPACRLPKKPSALIRLAIKDLIQAEKTPGYDIEMSSWHNPMGITGYDPATCKVTQPRCEVCLAGAVMAFTLNAPVFAEACPE